MTRDELIQYLADLAQTRSRVHGAVWWNGELIPIEEAMARAAELQEGDEVQVVHGEIIVNAHLSGAQAGQ